MTQQPTTEAKSLGLMRYLNPTGLKEGTVKDLPVSADL